MDFALWKSSKEGEPFWDSPWGRGRPGWHIECSAMSTKYLGQPFDIHGGGQDLIFPHNENEIAQSECATGTPFARYWIHNGFVQLAKEKMSKSLGNILTIKEILERVHPVVLRHYMLTTHYRNPVEFSEDGLLDAERAVTRIYETLERAEKALGASGSRAAASGAIDEFKQEMDDDFNTPRAFAVMFEELRAVNRMLDQQQTQGLDSRRNSLKTMLEVLGLLQLPAGDFLASKRQAGLQEQALSADDIERLIEERNRARADKNWARADAIRDELKAYAVVLKDGSSGTTWEFEK